MADISKIIPFTYKWEGGLSRATTDTASKNPSPYVYNGVGGWHTNKGITYPVFKAGATKYGYTDTSDTFKKMPEDVWLKIAKGEYWDKIKLDAVKSQAIANLMFSWQWGSGYSWRPRIQRYLKSKGITWAINDFTGLANNLNALVEKEGEKKIFDELVEQKRQFLISLNQPANEKGWINRLNDLKNYSYTLISQTATTIQQNPITTVLVTAGLVVFFYSIVKFIKK